jgi:peptide-methionine (R)-S-oxide reductase
MRQGMDTFGEWALGGNEEGSKQKLNLVIHEFFLLFLVFNLWNSQLIAQELESNEKNLISNQEREQNLMTKTDSEWKAILTDEEYRILREKGTERPFSGKYDGHFEEGEYVCAGCGETLYTSQTKYNSGCGWPAFSDGIEGKIDESKDISFGMPRTEIICSNCGGHLGHVFKDGPAPTGLRHCVNSVSLDFKPKKDQE